MSITDLAGTMWKRKTTIESMADTTTSWANIKTTSTVDPNAHEGYSQKCFNVFVKVAPSNASTFYGYSLGVGVYYDNSSGSTFPIETGFTWSTSITIVKNALNVKPNSQKTTYGTEGIFGGIENNFYKVDATDSVITIVGGTDTKNYDLINWLTTNCAQVEVASLDMSFGKLPVSKLFAGEDAIVNIFNGNTPVYEKKIYNITTDIYDGSATGPETIIEGFTAEFYLSPAAGYEFPTTISVLNAEYNYDQSTGKILIWNASGNVTITAYCKHIPVEYRITKNIIDGLASGDEIIMSDGGEATINITANTNYRVPDSIDVTGAGIKDYTTTDNSTKATLVLNNAIDNVIVNVTCIRAYTITTNIDHGTYSGDTIILQNDWAEVDLTAANWYDLPSSITVSGAEYTYNRSTGIVKLTNPTGNVSIVVTCYNIDIDVTNGTCNIDGAWADKRIKIVADSGYTLPDTIDYCSGCQYQYDNSTGILTLLNITGDVSVTITCIEYTPPGPSPTSYNISYNSSGATISPQPSVIDAGGSITYTIEYSYSTDHSFIVQGAEKEWISGDTYQDTYRVFNPTADVYIEASSRDTTCVLRDTTVLLADGTTKKVQDVKYNDLLLTYNPILSKFVAAYPALITETPDFCVNHVRRIILDNNNYLDIAGGHAILVEVSKNNWQFVNITALVDVTPFIGLQVVCYNGNSVELHKIIACEDRPQDLKALAYNVFVPMHGNIITNNIISGGDYLIGVPPTSTYVNNILYNNGNILEPKNDFINAMTLYINDADYNSLVTLLNYELPKQIFYSSYFQLYYPVKRLGAQFDLSEQDIAVSVNTLRQWALCYKPFEKVCHVKINDQLYQINTGDTFIFPAGHEYYIDPSSYKIYYPGDKKVIYTSINVECIDK